MRPLPPTPCAARPGEGKEQTKSQVEQAAPDPRRTIDQKSSCARPETATVDPNMAASEDSLARTERTSRVFQERPKTPPEDNRPARRVPPGDPESLPPASGSRRQAWRASGGART